MKKNILLMAIIFLLSFNYNLLRTMKDTLVVTGSPAGATIIPFIKVWVLFPLALLFSWGCARLANRFSQEKLFYGVIALFLLFFGFFAFLIFPNQALWRLDGLANLLHKVLPTGCEGFVATVRYPFLALFYALGELWGTILLFFLFWGFVNTITPIEEAKRSYGWLGFCNNLAVIPAAQASYWCSQGGAWGATVETLTSLVLIAGVACMLLFFWLNRRVAVTAFTQKLPFRLSLKEAFLYLKRSPYLLYLAVLVVAYNLFIAVVEVLWKDQVVRLYPAPELFNAYMSRVALWAGIIGAVAGLFATNFLLRWRGWTFVALICPVVLLITSVGFFSCLAWHAAGLAVLFGAVQNAVSRGLKYSLFDATKEIAYTPLELEAKVKGKTAIDGVGSRFGKFAGATLLQGVLLLFTTLGQASILLGTFLIVLLCAWIFAVTRLGKFISLKTAPNR